MRTKCHIEELEQRELDSYDLIEVLELFKDIFQDLSGDAA